MQPKPLITALTLLNTLATALPQQCRRHDPSRLLPRDSTCDVNSAGGAGDPLPNDYCKITFGKETPCCVENGSGGAFCTSCEHGVHKC